MLLSQELFSQYFQKPIIVAYFMKPDIEDTKKYLILNFQKRKKNKDFLFFDENWTCFIEYIHLETFGLYAYFH